MELTAPCPLARTLAARLRGAREELTTKWLNRIASRMALDPNRVFPTDQLLDHVPLLILGIADYLEDPAKTVGADMEVVSKARELGALRHAQGVNQFEILKEFEILGGILLTFVARAADETDEACTRGEIVTCAQRVFHAIALVQEATMTQYMQLLTQKLAEREERLRAFNRTLMHEFRNRVGASLGAGEILSMPGMSEEKKEELSHMIVRNARGMQLVLDNLLEMSHLNTDVRQQRHVHLPHAAAESVRELRDMAHAHLVTVRIAPDLPDVEVNAAAVELCLTNLISNAIKYADATKPDRWVEVRGHMDTEGAASQIVVQVVDNGIGVPEQNRQQLFDRFFRANNAEASGAEGTGLGLSIVRDTVESLGGTAWVEFPDVGSIFAFSLPCRRYDEGHPEELGSAAPGG